PGLGAVGDKQAITTSTYYDPTVPANLMFCSWQTHILPYLEQPAMWEVMRPNILGLADRKADVFACPSDRKSGLVYAVGGWHQSTSSYQGVAGINDSQGGPEFPNMTGVLFWRSRVRLADVTDGTGNTLMVGEHPASDPTGWWGWWDTSRD